jgi:WD40 repeat protein
MPSYKNVRSATMTCDKKLLACISAHGIYDRHVSLWCLKTHELVSKFEVTYHGAQHNDSTKNFIYSTTVGGYGDSATHECITKVWKGGEDNFDGFHCPLGGHQGGETLVKFSPDDTKLASLSRDSVIIWSTPKFDQLAVFNQHKGAVYTAAWSPDSRGMASAGEDMSVYVWDASTGAQVMQALQGHSHSVVHLAWNSKGTVLISASLDKTIVVWDLEHGLKRGSATKRHVLSVPTYYADGVSLSPDDKFLVCGGCAADRVYMWDINTGQQIRVVVDVMPKAIGDVVWSNDGQHVESIVSDGTVLAVARTETKLAKV